MAEMMIKAVPCRYAGITFRSTLEADWAATFDYYGMAWEYEPLAVETELGPYLPDFWLPEAQVWAEVKGPHNQRLDKALAAQATMPLIILRPSNRGHCQWNTPGRFMRRIGNGTFTVAENDYSFDSDDHLRHPFWPKLKVAGGGWRPEDADADAYFSCGMTGWGWSFLDRKCNAYCLPFIRVRNLTS